MFEKPLRSATHPPPPGAATPVSGAAFPSTGDFDAMFCRLLRGNIDMVRFVEHLNVMQQLGGAVARETRPMNASARVNDVLARITEIAQHVRYQEIVDQFYSPVPTLHTFFEAIDANYGARLGRFGIVLILDQFEELFTRFVESRHDWAGIAEPASRLAAAMGTVQRVGEALSLEK